MQNIFHDAEIWIIEMPRVASLEVLFLNLKVNYS